MEILREQRRNDEIARQPQITKRRGGNTIDDAQGQRLAEQGAVRFGGGCLQGVIPQDTLDSMTRIVKAKAFRSGKTVAIARSLLGKFLIRSTPRGEMARMITEVEAYDGERDRACHARRGRTGRNAVERTLN